ncbi:hypothetical protein [Aquabacterium sp.]|uniref:hypothetical protein n=1 Tax=Aquabacterium sp. TaxID=1872578 RepID=UPI00378382AB
MNRKQLVMAALTLAGLAAAGASQAHGVQWSVSIGLPVPAVVLPRPVVVAEPVVVPQPVYGAQPVYVPQPVYAPYHRAHYYQHPTRWDADGDGIPNRYDRVYNPRWDRDGDGVPNRYDHHYGRGR